jgi:thioredoxin-dependent peroxiredoxin
MAKDKSSSLEGKKLKNFTMASTGEQEFSLKDYAGKNLVLYFYPKDATPGCTIESIEFSKLLPKYQKLNTEIFGISRDSIPSHEKFKMKQKIKFDLLSDEDEKICQLFDVIKEKNMYGKKVMGIERSTFVVDPSGKVIKEWRKVKAEGHAEEVLDFVKNL